MGEYVWPVARQLIATNHEERYTGYYSFKNNDHLTFWGLTQAHEKKKKKMTTVKNYMKNEIIKKSLCFYETLYSKYYADFFFLNLYYHDDSL